MKSRSLGIVAMLTCATVLVLNASTAQAAFYNFNVESATATATDADTADWIRLSGAGQFSDTSGFVQGHGHFTHFSSDGQRLRRTPGSSLESWKSP
ncbi:MAG: hypothetical protein H6Q33_2104 [Deltaproteobacteria bacterium]|nr:hypothetical protein [Deltaproteobacteria bacterium]